MFVGCYGHNYRRTQFVSIGVLRMGAVTTRRLTEKQDKFVECLTLGDTQTEAARKAGYSHPDQDGYRLTRLPHIIAETSLRRAALIEIEGGNIAYRTLVACCDERYPGSVRVSAASKLAQMAGMVKPDAALVDRRDLQEMSPDELEAQLAKIDQALAGIASKAKPIDGQIIDQQGDNAAL